jgi:hypothetical protein
MLRIRINQEERHGDASDLEQWITRQVNGRRADGFSVCVHVDIEAEGVRLTLASSGCGGGGGFRPLSGAEEAVVDLWRECGMSEAKFVGGSLVAFVHRLRRLVPISRCA